MSTVHQFELTSILLTITMNKIKSLSKNNTHDIDDTIIGPEKTIIEQMLEMNNNVNPNNTLKNESFECIFVAQSYKTAKLFELNIESFNLPKINNIFAIDPTIIFDIIKENPHSVSIIMSDNKEDHIVIEYIKDFFNRKISFIFKIPEKQCSEGPDSEVIDPKRMNQYLHQEISEMKKLNQQYQYTVQDLKTEIIDLRNKIETQVSDALKKNTNNDNETKNTIIVPFNDLATSSEIAHNFLNNYCCCDEYRFIKKIHEASFSDIYLAICKGTECLCKVEKISEHQLLKGESNIYKRFSVKKLDCVPIVQKYNVLSEYNVLSMQLLGKNLDTIFKEQHYRLDIGTIIKLGITIISHLEKIHRTGIIHRNIKPSKFIFGVNENLNNLYIIGFSLSKKWCIDGNHINYRTERPLKGSAKYASVRSLLGYEYSRKDDMESLGYMLLYFANGSLPWQHLGNDTYKIMKSKITIDLKKLCRGLPECFYKYINYTRNLQFTEKPDYDYLRNLFINSAKTDNVHIKYFWDKNQSYYS